MQSTPVMPAAVEALPSWFSVSELRDVVTVMEGGVQLCVWRRPADEGHSSMLASVGSDHGAHRLEVVKAGERPTLATLPPGDARDWLAADIGLLGQVLCDLVGCKAAGVRMAHVTTAMCPGWHVDRVTLRMVCAYRGPGTEWLVDQGADRSKLRAASTDSGGYQRAGTGEVVFLKGAGWPGNESFGAIHRSPEVSASAGPRTVVTFDPIWTE